MIKRNSEFKGLNITINTTEDCNLRCKYCYEIDKKKKSIKFEDCKTFLDLIFSNRYALEKAFKDKHSSICREGFVLDFIGGDSLMDVDLLDKIIKYFIFKLNTFPEDEIVDCWKKHFRLSLSSNGTLFEDEKVRKFCENYHDILSLGVSIDGCPEIHDMNRIFNPELTGGKEVGSLSTILRWWSWYQEWFPLEAKGTKSTLSKCSIPYLFKSLKFMVEDMEMTQINQNFIMEDAHLTEEDYVEFDNQMRKCVEYTLQHCDEIYWSMIDLDEFAKHHLSKDDEWEKQGSCGSGCMPCLGINGKIYPCFRWAPHTQTKATKDHMVTGDIVNGFNKLENFSNVSKGAYRTNCTKEERCRSCEYESACSYCIGGCYAAHGDFVREVHICEITKLQCKWAKVYWNEYNKLKGLPMEFDEKYQLDKVPNWSSKNLNTNLGD